MPAGYRDGMARTPAFTPIEDYALVGDLHTAALISRRGSLDWLCLPRFDSSACFAALLGGPEAGSWALAPRDPEARVDRGYEDHTLVLRTSWTTATGSVEVLDYMPPRDDVADIVRTVRGISGRVDLESRMNPRFDYGRAAGWVVSHGREGRAIAGPDALWLHADVPLEVEDRALVSRFAVAAGDEVSFVLTHEQSHLRTPRPIDPARALASTRTFWSDWIGRCAYRGRWEEEVKRSLLLLKALTYAPTGGIVAAATTSLPEEIGGVRNWDYRFCWLRDATFTLQALLGTGYVEEARAWRDWLVRAVAGNPADLQIMYGIDGRRRMPELELDWLSGYRGSKPVREGNAAAEQLQLDVWGEVLDGLHLGREAGIEFEDPAWELQVGLLEWLEGQWDQPDNGIWEVRGPRQHFVHSKVLAWAGVDRMVHSVEQHGLDGRGEEWKKLRARIHEDVTSRGYDAERGTFTQFYGSKGLDASLLLIPRVGFLPWEDERVRGTVAAVQRELCQDGFLRRYDPDADGGTDGLPGVEGVFVPCSFWLVDALHGTGRTDEATALFDRLLGLRNDVGMLSEEYDVASGHHLGNTPQSFSLEGLVNSARQLTGVSTATWVGRGSSPGH